MKIFIQIASYRDPELLPTLQDCIAKAKHPERLRFGIAWQHGDEHTEQLREFQNDYRFRILDIPYNESKGVCWARRLIQYLYDDEDYTLQLDSHHRFVEHWDEICINMLTDLQNKGFKLPILSSYAPVYHPSNDPDGRGKHPMRIDFDSFLESGTTLGRPGELHDVLEPVNARFVSAHMLFTLGRFCRDIPYDSEYYFHGEELNLAVRAFTHGYDLFHPHVIICWHEYIRNKKIKHWDDDSKWSRKERDSSNRNKILFGLIETSDQKISTSFSFGSSRSLRDYERYAGICFAERAVSRAVLEKRAPFVDDQSLSDQQWLQSLRRAVTHTIRLPISANTLCSYKSVAVIYEDKWRTTLYRKDYSKELIESMFDAKGQFSLTSTVMVNYASDLIYTIIWPYNEGGDWGTKIETSHSLAA